MPTRAGTSHTQKKNLSRFFLVRVDEKTRAGDYERRSLLPQSSTP